MAETFAKSWAVVVGIDAYGNGISPLRSAVNDACEVARILGEDHQYEVQTLLNADASRAALTSLLTQALPGRVGPKDRVLVYFAGHGVALDGDEGPEGYIVPQDAQAADPSTLLPMAEISEALGSLRCRHMLLILDCCFAGAFRWTSTRDMRPAPKVLYRERFARFVRDPAWQVLTSAGSAQRASDVERRFGGRADDAAPGGGAAGANATAVQGRGAHSPFARALFDALAGKADYPVPRADGRPAKGDGVITATELYLYLRDRVEAPGAEGLQPQTPGLWPLPEHAEGEYVFLVPGVTPILEPAPALSPANNPYRGLQSYSAADKDLFFGRTRVIDELVKLAPGRALTVVAGASGSGKSSVVKAGLLPALAALDGGQAWTMFEPVRPTRTPLQSLAKLFDRPVEGFSLAEAAAAWLKEHPDRRLAVTIDQFEELITLCSEADREATLAQIAEAVAGDGTTSRLHVILTVRADFEPHFAAGRLAAHWKAGRFIVPPMSQNELRQAILGPADVRVLYFEPPALVDRIINEVVQMPGALPLLSFTLSELYLSYVRRGGSDRELTEQDYDALGGVAVALRNRANAEYDALPSDAHRQTMRRLLLRMVSLNGGELARRRVDRGELDYGNPDENARVNEVIERLDAARLIVTGHDPEEGPYVEPAHDALIQGWDRLWKWVQEDQEDLLLRQRLTPAAEDWSRNGRKTGQLWTNDPRLKQAEAARLKPGGWMNKVEAEFSDASERQRKRNQRRLVASLSAALAIFAVLAVLALLQANRATNESYARATQQAVAEAQSTVAVSNERMALTQEANAKNNAATAVAESKIATSRQLGAQSDAQRPENLDRSLLLARQAYNVDRTFESQRALLSSVQYAPDLKVFNYLPDGGLRAAAYDDKGLLVFVMACLDRHPAGYCAKEEPRLIRPGSGETVAVPLEGLAGPVWTAALSPDGTRLALMAGSTVRVWDLAQGQAVVPDFTVGERAGGLALSNDPSQLAVILGGDGVDPSVVEVWDLASGEATLEGEPYAWRPEFGGELTQVALSPDGRYLAGGGCTVEGGGRQCTEAGAAVWDLDAGAATAVFTQTLRVPDDLTDNVSALAFSPQGDFLAVAGEGKTVEFWEVPDGRKLAGEKALAGSPAVVDALAFSPDGTTLQSAGDGYALSWDVGFLSSADFGVVYSEGNEMYALRRAVALIGDGQYLLSLDCATMAEDYSGYCDGLLVEGTNLVTGEVISGTLPGAWGRQESPPPAALSPNGTHAAVLSDEQIVLWDLTASEPVSSTVEAGPDVERLALGPNGALLAWGDRSGRVTLYDVAAGQVRTPAPPQHGALIKSLAFSEDGKILASSDQNYEIRLWDTEAGRAVGAPFVDAPAGAVAVSNTGQLLAVSVGSTPSGRVRLYDLKTLQPYGAPYPLAWNSAFTLAFSADGSRLAADTGDVFDTNPAGWPAEACRLVNRNFSAVEWAQWFGSAAYCRTCPDLPSGEGAPQDAPACAR